MDTNESFQITIPLTNILAVVSICEQLNVPFRMAMQLYKTGSGYSADVFLFCESEEWTQGDDG